MGEIEPVAWLYKTVTGRCDYWRASVRPGVGEPLIRESDHLAAMREKDAEIALAHGFRSAYLEKIDKLERAEAQRDALLEAAKRVATGRHIASMQGSIDGETCSTCGCNWRDTSRHFITGESAESDMQALRSAIHQIEQEKGA